MVLALAFVLLLTQAPAATREERVLELLGGIDTPGACASAHFRSVAPAVGKARVIEPLDLSSCGNSDNGTFDDARARQLALELCALYDLAAWRDQLVSEGGRSVLLDGFDPVHKLGFKLRGRGNLRTLGHALPEHDATALDEGELAWLGAQGIRVHVADVDLYHVYDGDEFTPLLAYLAGVVRFLNEATDGEDVEVGGLLFEREASWPWRAGAGVVTPEGIAASGGGGDDLELVVEQAGVVTFPCRGLPDFVVPAPRSFMAPESDAESSRTARMLSGSTRGAPSVLVVPAHASPPEGTRPWREPLFTLRVRQRQGETELVHESHSFTLFLPSAFDLARPFELELELGPGRYSFWKAARLGAAATKSVPR